MQEALVYIVVFLATAYLVKVYCIPSSLLNKKNKVKDECGSSNCGCH